MLVSSPTGPSAQKNAATLRETAPVRIAGVNVGEVTGVEAKGDAAEVTFTVDDEGQPIHDDAQIEIRPRLRNRGPDRIEIGRGSRGPITEKIQSAFFDIVNGRNPKYAEWLTKV